MSTLSRYTIREILSHVLGVLAVLLGIFLVRRFTLFLTDATEGSLPLNAIFQLIVLRTITALPSLLPAIVYLAILLALGRLYQDHEMTAMASCGVAPGRIRRAVMAFALSGAAVIAVLSFSVRPWATEHYRRVKHRAMEEAGIDQVRPGRFYSIEQPDGGQDEEVVFAESRSQMDPQVLEDVFVQVRRRGRISVFYARFAVEQRDEQRGFRFLRLFDGSRYDLTTEGGNQQITRYQEFSIRTSLGPGANDPEASSRDSSAEQAAELQWRLAMPVSTLLLAFVAIPLARTSPRRGKYSKVLVAVIVYVVYRQLLGAAKSWAEEGLFPAHVGIWAVHALCLATGLALAAVEPERRQGWPRWFGRRDAAAMAGSPTGRG